ncbi:MAG: hypothetical protein IJS58_09515 [Bacilli bacterium]|nr:hypothetical protein [Bacilli bacterium]
METIKIKNQHKSLLIFQMCLISFGTIASIILLFFLIINKISGWMMIGSACVMIAYLGLTFYSIFGYKSKKKKFIYLFALIFYIIAIFVNLLLPFRNTLQIALLAILLILISIYASEINNNLKNYIILIIGIIISLIFSIYSASISSVDSLGPLSNKIFAIIMMYVSVFAPVFLTSTFALIHSISIGKLS